ncbi:hypothetical protein RND81_09G213900 [Saponaria officinalis]|uniref:Glycosyltransferase n=1 Tax=Saponaria officinalis TaxID=3572 RepID=A0AAW1IQS7_SAPOF
MNTEMEITNNDNDDNSNNNSSSNKKLKMFFLPAIYAISHTTPLMNAASLFASHPNAQVTIITTHQNAQIFGNLIDNDSKIGRDIGFHIVKVPTSAVGLSDDIVDTIISSTSSSLDNAGKLFKAMSMLSGLVLDLIMSHQADCLVSDLLNPWAANVAQKAHIPFVVFNPSNLFGMCVEDSLTRFVPHENLGSDTQPFVVPGLPDKVELTRSRLPDYFRGQDIGKEFRLSVKHALELSHCMMVNSFHELEFKYVEHCKNVMGLKCCLVGPLHCYSSGINPTQDQEGQIHYLREWLDHRTENSVLYVSFGSYAPMSKEQFHEIAHGLEGSSHPFIWVARFNLSGEQGEEGWFPEGFEKRVNESNKGMIIKTWAPQGAILGHPSVGAFMTHCGWNSCLETLSNGVPVITWPLRVEQFYNESYMVDVLRVGFRVGNEEWTSQHGQLKVSVTRDKVEASVRRMMNCGAEEMIAIRECARQFADKSKIVYQRGGSSYEDVYALVEELKSTSQ